MASAYIWASPTAFSEVETEGKTEHTRCLSLHVSDRFIAMDQAPGAAEEMRQAARLRATLCDALGKAALREPWLTASKSIETATPYSAERSRSNGWRVFAPRSIRA
jgi:hypothetical protein